MQIGSIQLNDFEVPASITFGGLHRFAVHKSANGSRIIDTLGPDDNDIRFRGIFSGQSAESRARTLNDLRLNGTPVWLSWGSFRYRVLLKSVQLDYRTRSWILYQASCLILDQPGAAKASIPTNQAQLATDLIMATNAATDLGIDMSSLGTLLTASSSYPIGSSERAAVLTQVTNYQAQLTSASNAPLASDPVPGSTPLQFAERFSTVVSAAGLLGKATVAGAYLGRIARSL